MKPEEKEPVNLTLTPEQKEIILSMARNDLSVAKAAKELYMHRNTVTYRVKKIKKETGLDCRKFYDMVKLVERVGEEG